MREPATCAGCSTELEEPADLATEERTPCPSCGSTRRVVTAAASLYAIAERLEENEALAHLGLIGPRVISRAPITISKWPCAVRSACSTPPGPSARAKRKLRYRSPSGRGITCRPGSMVSSQRSAEEGSDRRRSPPARPRRSRPTPVGGTRERYARGKVPGHDRNPDPDRRPSP